MESSGLPKHLVVTGYVLDPTGRRVLLLFHRKLQRWLPPGGHVEASEDPLRALVREVWEETGLLVRPLSDPEGGSEPGVLPLPRPHHVQVETIDGRHEHVDLAYVCEIVGGEVRGNVESEEVRWVAEEDLRSLPLGENVRHHVRQLLQSARPPAHSVGRSMRGPARRRTSRSVG